MRLNDLLRGCILISVAIADPAEKCTSLSYESRQSEPTVIPDTLELCANGANTHRAFLSSHKNSDPKEVKPYARQHYFCAADEDCSLSVGGYGVHTGDQIAVFEVKAESADVKCGDPSLTPVIMQHIDRMSKMNLVSKELLAEEELIVRSSGITTLKGLIQGDYKVCYVSELGMKDSTESDALTSADFLYEVGIVTVNANHSYFCDFEDSLLSRCGYGTFAPNSNVNFKWAIYSGKSTTPGSGPNFDTTLGAGLEGHYAIMKNPGYLGSDVSALMLGPTMVGDGNYCVSFDYHMLGRDVNTLRVYAIESALIGEKDDESKVEIPSYSNAQWGSPRWVSIGNKGEEWQHGGFQLSMDSKHPTALVFEGVSGGSELADIALDDVLIEKGKCPAEVMVRPKSLVNGKEMICGEVKMTTGQHPDDKSWTLDGALSCAGRGYSLDQLDSGWVPCCVPSFGRYEMVMKDSMGDGWEGSKLEVRFFDKVYTFGDEMKGRKGEVSVPLILGEVEIRDFELRDAETDEPKIALTVDIIHSDTVVYCGIVLVNEDGSARSTPDGALIREHGVSAGPTEGENQSLEVVLEGEFIKVGQDYDAYCYAEPANIDALIKADTKDIQGLTDDDEVVRTRFRFTADSTAPQVKYVSIANDFTGTKLTVSTDEPTKLWCVPKLTETASSTGSEEDSVDIPYIKLNGEYVEFDNGETEIKFEGLAGNSEYAVYCYAEDRSKPKANGTPDELLSMGGLISDVQPVVFKTANYPPTMEILRVSSTPAGFDVSVSLSGPGHAYCAAATANIHYPAILNVKKSAATAEKSAVEFETDPNSELTLRIRGVKLRTQYKIFCFATNPDGSRDSGEDKMWKSAVAATSYGKFCDIPAEPTVFKSYEATPFDPLTGEEEARVRNYMIHESGWNVESLYRMNLYHNKEEIYDYYDNGAKMPERFARVRLGRCLEADRGFFEQIIVGPLAKNSKLTFKRIAEPVETTCGGYVADGIFGRRLADHSEGLQDIFLSSFGFKFASEDCHVGEAHCLQIAGIAVETPVDHEVVVGKMRILREGNPVSAWVGLKRPSGDPVPFYFGLTQDQLRERGVELDSDSLDMNSIPRLLEGYNWNNHRGPCWYNGTEFSSIADMLAARDSGSLKLVSSVDYDQLLQQRSLSRAEEKSVHKRPSMAKRRLAPAPYPGGAGTAGFDLDTTKSRGGLEYKVPPEHVEPQGKRYTITSHPGGEAFTIDYAGWNFIVTNDRDKSLQLWNVKFQNERILFNVGMQEAMAHYTVAERTFFFMDSWYGGLGGSARPVLRGYECPKHGSLVYYDQSLCIWEQDEARPVRSHYRSGEIRDAAGHYTLNLRQMITVSNYDYVVTYKFHSTGHIESSCAFTGELYAGVEVPWYSARQAPYGTLVTGSMRMAALHAHLVVWKYDFDLEDHNNNSLWFEEVIPDPKRPGANYIDRYYVNSEKEGALKVEDGRNIGYVVISENRKTYGNKAGWRAMPSASWTPNRLTSQLYDGTGAWAKYKVWSTIYKESELDATLPRDNKFPHDAAVSIQRMIDDDESTRNTDLVTWMSMSFMHIPAAEDYPLTIPIGNTLSSMVRPFNWYLEDPSMDLHNSIGGDFKEPGQCAVVRDSIFGAMDTKQLTGPVIQ